MDLYENYVKYCALKMNQLHVVEITMATARQFYQNEKTVANVEKAVSMLSDISGCAATQEDLDEAKLGGARAESEEESSKTEDLTEAQKADQAKKRRREIRLQKRRKLGDSAFVVMQAHVAWLRLQQGKSDLCLALVENTKTILDAVECAPPVSHRAHFSAAAEYHALNGPADDYYRNRLQYVVYTPVEELTKALRVQYAKDLCLAALVSDKIYNFGEVVALPIFQSLKEDKNISWLSDLLEAFNNGDIERFNNTFGDHRKDIEDTPALKSNINKLKEKITLLCVMELIFKRPPSQRNISFAAIAKATQMNIKQVEWILIRAMSLGLIRGVIDEVDQSVNVTYIQPRVLDKAQLTSLKTRLVEWSGAVDEAVTFMESNTVELFE